MKMNSVSRASRKHFLPSIGTFVAALSIAGFAAAPVYGQEEIVVGVVGPFSGPSAIAGQQVLDGFNLAVEHNGGLLGGRKPRLIAEDDQLKPDVGLQATNKLIERDKVDIFLGPLYSHILLASFRAIMESKTPLISPVAGPALIAGKQCSPYFFNTSWQNDEPHEAMGRYLQDQGVKSVYLLAPNYQAGKETLNGFKRTFKGEVTAEVYTGLSQLDFAAEIAQIRDAKPDAVYVYYPATYGINFVKQYGQSGLGAEIPLYSASTVDEMALPAIGDVALGTYQTASWSFDLDNPSNVRFREDFLKKYDYRPTFVAAYAYDAAQLLHSALEKVKGQTRNNPEFLAALREADFSSVRGDFAFADDQFPIQDFYLLEVQKNEAGTLIQKTLSTVVQDSVNAYVGECTMANP